MNLSYRLKNFILGLIFSILAYLPMLFIFEDLPIWLQLILAVGLFFCSTLISTIIETNSISKVALKAKGFLEERNYDEKELVKKNEISMLNEFSDYCIEHWAKLNELVDSGDISSKLEELELTRARRIALFESAAYPIFIMGVNKKIIDVNKELAFLVSYEEARLEGAEVRFILPDNTVIERLLSAMETQTFWQGETDILTAKGDFIPVKLRVTKIVADNVTLIQVFVDDLRELREKEKELHRQTMQIEKFDKLMVNRELRMIELKNENEKLIGRVKKINK